jgi:thioredoxin 1
MLRSLRSTAVCFSAVQRSAIKRFESSGSANFEVLGNSNTLADKVKSGESKVLYFTATWCPPCKMIAPIFEKLSKEFPQTQFIKIDIDDHADAAADFEIRTVPTFMFYKGDSLKKKFSGANEAMLRNNLTNIQ